VRKLLALAPYLFIGFPAILGGLFLAPAKSWVLDRDFYKRIVSGPEARAVLESPQLYDGFDGTLKAGDHLVLSGPASGKALQKALPVPAVLSAAENAVDSAFDALESETPDRRFKVDLRTLKTALNDGIPEFSRVYSTEVSASPSVSAANLALRSSTESVLDLSARPADLSEADFQKIVRAALNSALAAMPENMESDLPSPRPSDAYFVKNLNPRDALNRVTIWLALLAGGVWLAGAFISSDSANKRLKWLGTTLVLPGIVVLATGAVLRLAADPLALRAIQDPDLQRILADPSLAAVRNWIHRPFWTISTGFLVSGSVAVILGGGLLASRKALKYRDFE